MLKRPSRFGILLVLFASAYTPVSLAQNRWSLGSPDGRLLITVELTSHAELPVLSTPKHRLYYRVLCGPTGKRKTILRSSPLGIAREDQSFIEGLSLIAASRVRSVHETYTLSHGKRRQCEFFARERILTFQNKTRGQLQLILRAFNEGVAFRYLFPEQHSGKFSVTEEATGFRIPQDGIAWMQPFDEPSQWAPAYEAFFMRDLRIGTPSPRKAGWCLPALFRLYNGAHWILLTEAGLDPTYFGGRLAQQANGGLYSWRLPEDGEGNGTGAIRPSSSLPWSTPWRLVIVGNSASSIAESSLVTHLSPASKVSDTSWIRPGRASWSWWSAAESPKKFQEVCAFVDLAASMGWEYSLVDAGWPGMEKENVAKLTRYATSRRVGLLFWYNSGGRHNSVDGTPRDRMDQRDVRRQEFRQLQELGVKGVKIDFFQSDKQNLIRLYFDILDDAADYHLMVNFHGCTLPRGWERTYPHLMSMEAVRGAESYAFDPTYPAEAPWHNTILPFTRNVVGPMDYTPVTFSDNKYPHLTTNAHELALSVVFESGWIHFADRVTAYQNLAEAPRRFLQQVPASWDDSRFLSGEPGKYVVVARRKGRDWFIGGINGQETPQSLPLQLTFLDPGTYAMTLIGDGNSSRTFRIEMGQIKAKTGKTVPLRRFGGFVMHLRPETNQ